MAWLFTNGKVTSNTKLQWAPLLTSHDPNPPIALEGLPAPEINPTGIASSEAFGTLTITITVSPTGIASSEAFGTLVVGQVVSPASISSGEAFGNPEVIPDQSLTPTGIVSGEAFGNLSITISVSPLGIGSSEAFGDLQISLAQLIFPSGISSEVAFGVVSILLYPPPPPSYALSVSCGYRSCGDTGDFSNYSLQDGSDRTASSSSSCETRTCTVLPDVDIYNIQTGNIAPESNVVLSCATKTCPDSGVTDVEIYSLQDALFFNGTPLTVIIPCLPGFVCPDGSAPYTFTYPPGTFYFPQPPPGGAGGCPYELKVNGCLKQISRLIPCGASQDFVDKAAGEIIQEMATQNTLCNGIAVIWPLVLTVYDNVPKWVCVGSKINWSIAGRTYSIYAADPTQWPVTDWTFPNSDQPIWMSASFKESIPGGNSDSKYFGTIMDLSGTAPTTSGTFEFTVFGFAEGPIGSAQRIFNLGAQGSKTYVVDIIGIDTASTLSNAVPEQEYTQYFAATGFGATPLWGLAGGDFPDWLTFNTYQGVIYGTPPIVEDGEVYTFSIFVQDGERQCVKEFELEVGANCPDWSLLSWSTTIINGLDPKTGNNLAASIDTSATTLGPSGYSYIQMTTAPIARSPSSSTCCLEIIQSISAFSLLPWNIIMSDQDGNAYVLATALLNPVGVYTFNIPETVTSFVMQTNIDARCLPHPDGTAAAGTNILKATLYQCP